MFGDSVGGWQQCGGWQTVWCVANNVVDGKQCGGCKLTAWWVANSVVVANSVGSQTVWWSGGRQWDGCQGPVRSHED